MIAAIALGLVAMAVLFAVGAMLGLVAAALGVDA